MAKPQTYVRASLWDRLVDDHPREETESMPLRVYTPEQLRAAVQRDLEWLLNTRCAPSAEDLDWRNRTVIDYGIPDFGTFFTRNPEDWRLIAEILQHTIQAYEPRLREVRVTPLQTPHTNQLRVTLNALLKVDDVEEPITFPMVLSEHGGKVTVSS